jgi:hypothetical protein
LPDVFASSDQGFFQAALEGRVPCLFSNVKTNPPIGPVRAEEVG